MPTITTPNRTLRIIDRKRTADGTNFLTVRTRIGEVETVYFVKLTGSERIGRFAEFRKSDGTTYRCTVAAGLSGSCTCPDFTYRRTRIGGECKHIAATRAIVAKGD